MALKSKIILVAVIINISFFAAFGFVAAQQGPIDASNPVSNPSPGYLLSLTDIGQLIYRAIDWLLYLSGGLAVVFLLVGGFQYITSRGNEEATEKAKKTITAAVIGLLVVIMAYAIVTIVENLLIRTPEESTAYNRIEQILDVEKLKI